MTEMPQLVAAMHSLVGLAAVFIGFNADIEMAGPGMLTVPDRRCTECEYLACAAAAGSRLLRLPGFALKVAEKIAVEITILRVEIFLGVFIGAVTFTGSVIAFGKLAGKVDGKAKKLPGGHMLNAGAAALSLSCCWSSTSNGRRRWR